MKKILSRRSFLGVGAVFMPLFMSACSKQKEIAKKVVFVGFDGLAAKDIDKANMPNLAKLRANGSVSLAKRSVLPSSSAVNWASIFCGAGPELHGYTTWGAKKFELEPRVVSKYGNFPSIFGVLRDARPSMKTALFHEWGNIANLVESRAISHIENIGSSLGGEKLAAAAANYIAKESPDFIAVVFDEPDSVGHKFGWYSKEYFEMLKKSDESLGKIVKAVNESKFADDTVIIVSSDHGGLPSKNHGGKTMDEMQTPLVFCGKNIKRGFAITDSVMQYDISPTVAKIFGIDKLPQVWIGRPVSQIFDL